LLAVIALGFRLHTGWAALVAVGEDHKLHLRRRVELLDNSIPRFVYHAAAEMPLADAEALIHQAETVALDHAHRAIAAAIKTTPAIACGVAIGSGKLPSDLPAILRSHALIHSSEGALFQNAVIAAAKQHGLKVTATREKGLWAGLSPALRSRIEEMRSDFGPPWTVDQKIATAVALTCFAVTPPHPPLR
jgi:hypothetical protein